MSARRIAAFVMLAAVALATPLAGAQSAASAATQITALIGLARTARDQGRPADAVRHFEAARRLRTFDTPLLVEYFWVAHRAGAEVARELGEQILRLSPGNAAVRDGLIGVLALARDEAAAQTTAQTGMTTDPHTAVWPRRLAESFLRAGDGARAAEYFKRAAALPGGSASDRAMSALALESTTDKAAAARAWSDVEASIWSARPDWSASRERALAAVRPVAVPRPKAAAKGKHTAPSRVATPAEILMASRHKLASDACATAPLAALEGLLDPEPFIAAVAARPVTCAGHADWAVRAAERAIGLGRFPDALRVIEPAADITNAPWAVREQHAVLLHWMGYDGRAEPLLRTVVATAPAPGRATDALIDVLRATQRPDEAWPLALARWGQQDAAPERRLALASLALETGRTDEALSRAHALEQEPALGMEARSIAAAALLARGQPGEAKQTLGGLPAEPHAALTWLNAVAATDGIRAALRAAQAAGGHDGLAWADVVAHQAVWHSQVGEHLEAERLLGRLTTIDRERGALAAAEVAIATGRPSDATAALRNLTTNQSLESRAKDLLATALAEQGQWDEALATLGELRQRRPHDGRLTVREAAWRDRRAPSATTLVELESAVSAVPSAESIGLLARAYVRAGRYDRASTVLSELTNASVEAHLLRAEIAAATGDVAAADAAFEKLTSSEFVDPAWYLAWADVHKGGPGMRPILDRATQHFPADALLQERLAVAAWAARDRETALRAADAALTADQHRMGAWFVRIAGTSGRPKETAELVDRFEQRFADSPTALLGMGDMLSSFARSPRDPAALKALEWTTRIRASQPNMGAAVLTQVRLFAALGQRSRAMSEIEALAKRQPTLPEAHKLRAELLAALGSYTQAISAYDRYLALAPDDLSARRQQARIDGWRGDTGSALARYEKLRTSAPGVAAIAAEADAKRAYYGGRWREALRHYDAWLAIEPAESEAQLERAQLLDHLGETVLAARAYEVLSSDHRVAALAADRLGRRRAPSVDLFAIGTSADGVSRRQLLDMADAGAGFSTGVGGGHGTRARVFGGTSLANAEDRDWRGQHIGAQFVAATASPVDLGGHVVYRKFDGVEAQVSGDARLTWKALQSLRLSIGGERSFILENGSTMVSGLSGIGPAGRIQWHPNSGFRLEVAASHLALDDDNTRGAERADLSQRIWGRSNEVRLVGSTEHLAFAEARENYFTPRRFWRHDAGLEWRGWLATPQFYGDREQWISAAYLFGTDDRSERYHTARVGFAYEITNGVGVVADGHLTRSRVYDGARLSIGLRLKHVPTPVR